MGTRTRLVLLFGGRSAEHDVSCVSARHVAGAADKDRFETVALGITREGQWRLAELPDPLPDRLDADGLAVAPAEIFAEPDTVVFPLIHGPMGEDGTIQGLLEVADVPYVGSGVLASALCMDKSVAKLVCAQHGLPQCRYRTASASDLSEAVAEQAIAELGLPLFVKPANMGSSVGVSRAATELETVKALETAAQYDETLIIEEAVTGQEIEVSVLGNRDPKASVPGEIVPGADFYDYADKYLTDSAELLVPAQISEAATQDVQRLAIAAYRALRCEGMARADFLYEADGRGMLLSEVNTIPGFTPISMYPKLWEASGLPYPQLIETLVDLANERYERRRQHRRTDRDEA
ncbi:D-alanine--D-alanine ligase family protein [Candidatus Poriferisocius sp.]|uniref:D-alanine--D-alanine ligase family protein n=1 Tax=Candidatus Poriferisocius sp. TaxID=3101276 RepID=UPI003B0155BB